MKHLKFVAAAAATVAVGFTLSNPGYTCCCLPRISMTQPNATQAMRLAQQKALIYREKDKEHLVLSVQYEGSTSDFAWIIPTESVPKVDVQSGAPFNELYRLTFVPEPRAPEAASMSRASKAEGSGVQVIERKEAGPYELAVLKATDTGGLYDWLKANKFHISKNAKGALDHYVQRNYAFVAARIRGGSQDNQQIADRLKAGTIAPIHMVYKTAHLSYPLKVTTGNPGPSQMELYVLDGDNKVSWPGKKHSFTLKPLEKENFAVEMVGADNRPRPDGIPRRYVNNSGHYPTLRKLMPKGGTLVHFSGNLTDEQRQQDLVLD